MSNDVKPKVVPRTPKPLPFQRRKQLERDLEHITKEMYLRNKELADTNKTLTLLQTIETLALEANTSVEIVCGHICDAITQITGHTFVGILTQASHSKEELTLKGWSGTDWIGKDKTPAFSRPLYIKLDNPWFDQLEKNKLLSLEGLSRDSLSTFLNCPKEDILRIEHQFPLKSLYIEKLIARRRIVGLLVIGFQNPIKQLSLTDSVLLGRLSESIGLALDSKLLFEENRYFLKQLRVSNTKLRALDETKDDFISMASHQLRTPLTSIKGYISMMLEGDAGKINATQKEMLNQTFFSSQRMVYLIADMLNVSRLKTGKFAIENVPVNLAEVVEQELEQLKETAAAHSVKLSYTRPKDFPTLMLDETKIRQVIMNFSDNAIYYTPSGGHIEVQIVNKPSSIELRVKDDGIGVPRSERHHLFTKFYRAGNARKARPDGTGLGLYMAKKVIMAQGGTLIFESEEGKGSTFGFSFNKAKLKVIDKQNN